MNKDLKGVKETNTKEPVQKESTVEESKVENGGQKKAFKLDQDSEEEGNKVDDY